MYNVRKNIKDNKNSVTVVKHGKILKQSRLSRLKKPYFNKYHKILGKIKTFQILIQEVNKN